MHIKLRPYHKKFDYTYAIGPFVVLELLTHKRDAIMKVFVHPHSEKNEGVHRIREICKEHHIETEINDGFVQKVSEKGNSYVVAVMKKYHEQLEQDTDHLVLVNPHDRGNLGTIMRTMVGFGLHNLAIIRPGVDMFEPHVIRASMGALFQIKVQYFNRFEDYMKAFPNNPYLFITSGETELSHVTFTHPAALVFGSEASGLPVEMQRMGHTVTIKQSPDIDSLNLAVSAALGMYMLFTQ